VLPDGRPTAITSSWDTTVRIWDLHTGTPLGEPLTGHTRPVTVVAALVLPDGRPIAITGSMDKTVRIWDLAVGAPVGCELGVSSPVSALAIAYSGEGLSVVVGGPGMWARADVLVEAL
jgi:WD40 repeat protein